MLSMDDRRRLEIIAKQVELEDPGFARAMSQGRPRGDRRWLLGLGAVVAGLVFLAGVLTATVVLVLVGGVGLGCAAAGLWLHARGRPIRGEHRSP